MIHADDIEHLKDLFGLLLINAKTNGFPYSVLQEKIVNSDFINRLENNNLSFNRNNDDEIIAAILDISKEEINIDQFNPRLYWMGEFYVSLFIRYQKPFSFLFLYFPIETSYQMFDLYHEMDETQYFECYEIEVNKKSILTLLLNKNHMTLDNLATLSGINKNSLMKYAKGNKYIYKACFENIFILSNIFMVPTKIFIKQLLLYTNSERFEFDKNNIKYRNYLAYYFLSYYSRYIRENKFHYDEKVSLFTNGNEKIKVVFTPTNEPLIVFDIEKNDDVINIIKNEVLNNNDNEKTILVIFEYTGISEEVEPYLLPNHFKNIFIINQNYILNLAKKKSYEIPYFVSTALINRAKRISTYDFALFDK